VPAAQATHSVDLTADLSPLSLTQGQDNLSITAVPPPDLVKEGPQINRPAKIRWLSKAIFLVIELVPSKLHSMQDMGERDLS
jgi:hypothetical protein